MNLKSLAKDTAVYGLSSIVGRFLNYLLVPVYTYRIAAESGGYGIVSNLYAYTAFFLALLTFGMETTLFRFSGKEGRNPDSVFGNALKMVSAVALLFIAAVWLAVKPISALMGYAGHPEYVGCMATVVAFDAIQAIMFSRLRQQHKPVKFMLLKFAFIIPNVLLNLFIFLVMPKLFGAFPALEQLYSHFDSGVGLIFFANLICTSLVFIGFGSELKGFGVKIDRGLCREMLSYTWPLLIFSIVGILNQVADKILFPYLMPGSEGMVQLGIYGACVKIAMIMSLLVQAFRYAYEPIVFNGSRDKDNPRTLADGMKWFVVFSLLAFLAVMAYMPLLRHFIAPAYWEGLGVVPVVMLAELFMGVYFNLSFWYKLTDKTWWGAVMSAAGVLVMISVNVVLVPEIGYWACAWGGLAGYGVAMLMSLLIGRNKYPVPYDRGGILMAAGLAAVLFAAIMFVTGRGWPVLPTLVINTFVIAVYCLFVLRMLKSARYERQ